MSKCNECGIYERDMDAGNFLRRAEAVINGGVASIAQMRSCESCCQPVCSRCAVVLEDGPHCKSCAECSRTFRIPGYEERESCDRPATHCNEDGDLVCDDHWDGTKWVDPEPSQQPDDFVSTPARE